MFFYLFLFSCFLYGVYKLSMTYSLWEKTKILYKIYKNLEIKQDLGDSIIVTESLSETTATIFYKNNGRTYRVAIPYSRENISKMLNKKVLLVKNGDTIDITQQPGIGYMFDGYTLGGILQIEDYISGETITLEQHKIPFQ